LQRAVDTEVEKNRAQAELGRARAVLDRLITEEHARATAQRAAAQKLDALELEKAGANYQDLAAKQRELARQLAAATQRDTNKELKAILDLLAKQQETLKDTDVATRKALQDAMDRLKEAMKKLPAEQWRHWQAVPPIPPMPAAPKPPVKPGAIVQLAPRAPLELLSDGDERALRTWVQRAPSQGRLGIRVEPPGALLADQLNLSKDQGMVVAEVFDNSVAKKAGIKVNDILLKVNQQAVSSNSEAFIKLVADIKADTPFDIVVLRRGKQETIQNVRLAEATPQPGLRTAVRLRQLAGAKDAQIMITVSRKDNKITLNRNEGELMITVEAEAAEGKTKVTGIAIVEKGKTSKYGKVEEVPEPNRAKVQHLLQLLDSAGGAHNFQYRLVPRTRGSDSDQDVLELLLPLDKALEIKPLLPRQIPLPGSDESKDLYYRIPKGKSTAPSLNIDVLRDLQLEGELELSGNVADLLKLRNALPKESQKKTAPDRP
jgi:hypothetical protein